MGAAPAAPEPPKASKPKPGNPGVLSIMQNLTAAAKEGTSGGPLFSLGRNEEAKKAPPTAP